MNGRDVATRMRAIEDNISGEIGEDAPPLDRVVAVLLDLDYVGLDAVLVDEVKRTVELARTWYAGHGAAPTVGNIAGLAFVQGVTFAIAAQRLYDEGER